MQSPVMTHRFRAEIARMRLHPTFEIIPMDPVDVQWALRDQQQTIRNEKRTLQFQDRRDFLNRLSIGDGVPVKTDGEKRAVRYLERMGYVEYRGLYIYITDAGRTALASTQGVVLGNG